MWLNHWACNCIKMSHGNGPTNRHKPFIVWKERWQVSRWLQTLTPMHQRSSPMNCLGCCTFSNVKRSGTTCCLCIENTLWYWMKVLYSWTWNPCLYICEWALECVSLWAKIQTRDRSPGSHGTTCSDRIWSQAIAHLQMVLQSSFWCPVCDRFQESSCWYAQ